MPNKSRGCTLTHNVFFLKLAIVSSYFACPITTGTLKLASNNVNAYKIPVMYIFLRTEQLKEINVCWPQHDENDYFKLTDNILATISLQ